MGQATLGIFAMCACASPPYVVESCLDAARILSHLQTGMISDSYLIFIHVHLPFLYLAIASQLSADM